jgi:uncharacterized membrane protein
VVLQPVERGHQAQLFLAVQLSQALHARAQEIFDEQLRSFDLLIFHNFNYKPYWVEPYLPGVRDYIQSGGALAMIGGDLSFASGQYGESALRDVLPVDLAGIPADGPRAFSTDNFKP